MIRGFKDSATEQFFSGSFVPWFQSFAAQAERRLTILDNAASLRDLSALRGNRLEALAGDRLGQYSIRINRQWRICFRWEGDSAYDVEIVDYH